MDSKKPPGITTRETIDLVSLAVVNGNSPERPISPRKGFVLEPQPLAAERARIMQ